ncbi:MAG: hypothetical protein DUD27_07705 [Lachnospiraceae bacterium]|uniref:Uncharacterized protein n=1 Tax=Candidatus Weimeria bifida TaxID=2599074 RepID=A0A6N7IXL1_9FIRM|nr:hypothetical protein [Candidatus Weimeria bifida]RRF95572.1 MAG: hypothetical protein DUD27_07705 [Lachnospiraceae bacterium]
MFVFVLAAIVGVGILAMSLIKRFWNDIRDWLNNTAADVVQKYLGYDARKAMQKAVNRADRVMNKIRNVAQVYYRKDPLATHYDKVTMETTAPTYEFDDEFVKTVNEQGSLSQEMEYKQ